MRRSRSPLGLLLATAILAAMPASATVITATFLDPAVDSIPTTLPVLLGGGMLPDYVILRFDVPGAAQILSLNSIDVRVPLYDDAGDIDNEQGEMLYALGSPGTNISIATFGTGFVQGSTSTTARILSGLVDLTGANYNNVLNEIHDTGKLRIRVNRDGGDFYVGGAGPKGKITGPTVFIDAELAPEPSTFALLACALALGIALYPRRRRS